MEKRKINIGIITYFHFYNYGTMLQAYALQDVINKINRRYNCELINYLFLEKTFVSKRKLMWIRIKRLFNYIVDFNRVFIIFLYRRKMKRRNRFFDSFVAGKIHRSKEQYLYNEDLEARPPVYDLYITGSDQTWSPKIGFNPALFLSFIKNGGMKAAYAPSVGVTSFSEKESTYLRKYLTNYKYISCRESIGAQLLSEITGKPVEVVLDPTLLLNADDWRKLMVVPNIKKPYILCYFLGHHDYYRRFVKRLFKQTGYTIYYIPVSYIDCKRTNNLIFDAGPSEFLGLIDNAEYVCTDSFHGVAFCSNFNKSFYAFIKHPEKINGGDNSRLYDYLDRIGLTDRLIENYSEDEIEISKIDYKYVNECLEKERRSSMHFISEIINNL